MSILGNTNNENSGKMGTPFFHEFKKQASFFFKEKIKTARLALTDVTPVELLTEEATNGNPWPPDARSLKIISRAAFEVDDYWRIVEILHKRLSRFDKKNWRVSYNAMLVLEHLLTHGPESASEEFQRDTGVIRDVQSFQHIDEKGFNWGLNVRKKSERILKLLEKGPLLKEERDRARKVTRGIEGFGSFSQRSSSSTQGILGEKGRAFGRSHTQFNEHGNEEDESLPTIDANRIQTWSKGPNDDKESIANEMNPLLGGSNNKRIERLGEEDHPFSGDDCQASVSLLSTVDEPLQAF